MFDYITEVHEKAVWDNKLALVYTIQMCIFVTYFFYYYFHSIVSKMIEND